MDLAVSERGLVRQQVMGEESTQTAGCGLLSEDIEAHVDLTEILGQTARIARGADWLM
jgi:hypothetical protein